MDDKRKIFVRIKMAGPAILEYGFNFVGFKKLGTHFKHGQTLVKYAEVFHEKWIYIRLTTEELAEINLATAGTIFLEKHNLYVPYWAISTVEFSSSDKSVHPANRHWSVWSQFPGWANLKAAA